jgi:hypothetical protein
MAISLTSLSTLNQLNSGSYWTKLGGLSVNLPSLATTYSKAGTIGAFVASAGSVVQTFTKGARGIFCIASVLTNPTQLLNVLTSCLDYLGAIGLQLVNDLYKTCIARLNNILSTVYGITLSYFNTIKNIINCIKNIGKMFKKIYDWWKDRSWEKLMKLFDRENCDFMVANLLRCLMSKWLEPYISKLQLKATQAINDVGNKINSKIIDSTATTTALSTYLDNQTQFINKFTAQVGAIF